MPRLILKNIKTEEEQSYNLPQELITIGRINTCDIELPFRSVSRKHAEITAEGDDYFLTDLQSGNGTLLNGNKIKAKEKNLLRQGDIITIEDFEIHFHRLDESLHQPVGEDTDSDIIEIKMIKKVLKALDSDHLPSLEVLNSSSEGTKLVIEDDQEELYVGREKDCALILDDPTVSRQHAKLKRKWGGIVLLDLGSKNGCHVNKEKVSEKILHDGDHVMFGTVKCLFRNPNDINIDAISKEISKKKREAALKEAERIAQEEEAEKSRQEEEAKAAEEALKLEAEAISDEDEPEEIEEENQAKEPDEEKDEEEISVAQNNAAEENLPESPASEKKPQPGMSLLEIALLGIGAFVLLAGLVTIIYLMI